MCVCVHICVCMPTWVMCVYVHPCTCVCVCMHAWVVCVYAHVHVCVCLHARVGECGIELPEEGCLGKQEAKEDGGGGFLRRAK